MWRLLNNLKKRVIYLKLAINYDKDDAIMIQETLEFTDESFDRNHEK